MLEQQSLQMKLQCLLHIFFNFLSCFSRCDTPIDVRRIGRISRFSFFNDNQIFHFLKRACLKMLFCVPGAKSSFGFPDTVTKPYLRGCLN